MKVTATQAKNRIDAICAQAKSTETLARRKEQFEQTHGEWLAEQNQRFESKGLWCDDMRVW